MMHGQKNIESSCSYLSVKLSQKLAKVNKMDKV